MTVAFYMDVHIPLRISEQLALRGVDVLTAQADSTTQLDDESLLNRATSLGRLLFTEDEDFLRIGAERQSAALDFAGIVFLRQRRMDLGRCISDLELIAKCYEPDEMLNRIEFLPL